MTDLTLETRVVCSKVLRFETTIIGSKGDEYHVTFGRYSKGEWHCPCSGFQWRNNCSHIHKAMKQRCTEGEDALAGGAGLEYGKPCPKCGGPTETIQIAT